MVRGDDWQMMAMTSSGSKKEEGGGVRSQVAVVGGDGEGWWLARGIDDCGWRSARGDGRGW